MLWIGMKSMTGIKRKQVETILGNYLLFRGQGYRQKPGLP